MIIQNRNNLWVALTLGLLVMSLSACTAKRAAKAEAQREAAKAAGQPIDMTRPPTTIGAEREIVVESDPNETISFEEWRRRQEAGSSSAPDAESESPE